MRRALARCPMVWCVAWAAAATACGNDERLGAPRDAGVPEVTSPDGGPPSLAFRRALPDSNGVGHAFSGCLFASPLSYLSRGGAAVVIADAGGRVTLIDAVTFATIWQIALPAPSGEVGFVVGTPAIVGSRLIVSYHTTLKEEPASPNVVDPRRRHRVAVVDLERGQLDPGFEVLELAATVAGNDARTVSFLPSNALGRSALVHVPASAATLGSVYVTFGNARDIQPWHGWAFELSLDAWYERGAAAATTQVIVTTPEADCGPAGESGSRERTCGGGLWAPSGPLLLPRASGSEIILAPGNGQLDPLRRDYANTLMRVQPGRPFDPECDPTACAGFDADAPATACVESCKNLFIPRIPPGQAALRPESGACDGLGMFECWGKLDYIGGSTPALVSTPSGRRVLAYPTKDGHAYLVDADHLGAQYDRHELVSVCGTATDRCMMDWAGMSVTQPAVAEHDDVPVVIIPTFMPDATHPAGVVALNVIERDGLPRFERRWEFPRFDSAPAHTRFRIHPSRLALASVDGVKLGLIVEAAPPNQRGKLLALDTASGQLAAETELLGPGYRYSLPLVHGRTVFVASCATENGPGTLEAYTIDVRD